MSNLILKEIASTVKTPLTNIINTSIKTGSVPDLWKVAKVIPLHKGGDETSFNNYRPISLLSVYSKVLEKTVHKQLYNFAEDFILSKFQFGFRNRHETTQAVLNYLQNIENNMSRKHHVSVFIDIKKAFDSVSHRILLAKLDHYGLDKMALKWFKNYLTNRRQRTVYESEHSEERALKCGVPQGSILGPLLFLIFINDMPLATKLAATLFADDTTYQLSGDDLRLLEKELNHELQKASKWFADNHLTLHPGKTRYVCHGKKPERDLILMLNGTQIKRISKDSDETAFKFLGLWIDEDLNWKEHVAKVTEKVRKLSFKVIQLKKFLSKNHVIMIYKGLVKPVMEYGIQIWGHAISKELVKANKKVIRIVNYKARHTHVEPILKEMNCLQLRDLYKSRVFTTLNKIRLEDCPIAVMQYIEFNDDSSRRWYQVKSGVKLTKLQRSLPKFHQAKAWNEIMTPERKLILDFPLKRAKIEIRKSFLDSYYSYCKQKHCYSCTLQKKLDLAAMREWSAKQEEKERMQREKALAEEQKRLWREAKLL